MAHLFNRNVLLGVSGGIAAYKSAELLRQLQQRGATVRVIMTRGAQEFITPLTLQALSGQPVHTASGVQPQRSARHRSTPLHEAISSMAVAWWPPAHANHKGVCFHLFSAATSAPHRTSSGA